VQMSVSLTDKDGDIKTDSDNNIGNHINFEDDGPAANGTAVAAPVDEDGAPLNQGNVGGPGDVSAGSSATGSIAGIFNAGADGVKNYALSTDTSGLSQTLNSQGAAVKYDVNSATQTLTAYVENGANTVFDSGTDRVVFTLALSGTNNSTYTFTLSDQLDHLATDDPATAGVVETAFEDNLVLNMGSILQVVDKDNDVATAASEKLVITVNDDSPVINSADSANDISFLNSAKTGSGTFDYSIGLDNRSAFTSSSSDLLLSFISGTVGSTAISNTSIGWTSESATQAVFTFGFDYNSNPADPNAITHDTGTITFDKVNHTDTVTLTNAISSFSILTLADKTGTAFQGYQYNSTTTMGGLAGVSTASLGNQTLFVQFTGFAEPSGNGIDSGTTLAGNANLDALALNEVWSHSDDDVFTTAVGSASELFTCMVPNGQGGQMPNPATVSISGTSAGTNSDTMQSGEVLDFNLYSGDPKGLLNPVNATKTAVGTIFLEFDQLSWDGAGKGEDMVIVLKLVDANNSSITTTRAVIVQASDIYHSGDALPSGFGFTQAISGNNGMVILERNDYNFGTDNWKIQGAQVLASTEGVTSAANSIVDLNKAVGTAAGASTLTSSFSATADSGNATGSTWDSDVFKIVNIGFLTDVTPNAQLNFGVKVHDYDLDTTGSQTITVGVSSGSSSSASIASASSFTSSATFSSATTDSMYSLDQSMLHHPDYFLV